MEEKAKSRIALPGFVLLFALIMSASIGLAGTGHQVMPGVTVLTGHDLSPFQTSFELPELADPYLTPFKDSILITGTAQYALKFKSVEDVRRGGPFEVTWNEFFYADGTPMASHRTEAHSWDMKPALWSRVRAPGGKPRLWDPARDAQPPQIVWYGGHMRPSAGRTVAQWPIDNYSRDVFAFTENSAGKWTSQADSIFPASSSGWPRAFGNYLGHRYGHQIVMVGGTPKIFYEEVTEVREDGNPRVTKAFMDEMASPTQARGKPVELISPINPATSEPYPSALREDGALLVEGPLYFRFLFEGEEWEAIGFSAGSFYGNYPSSFASRKVADGRHGRPFQVDLNDQGNDLHDAGAALGFALNLTGGPGRPSVIIRPNGRAILDRKGRLQLLVHGYRRDILPDLDYRSFPVKYRLDQMFRVLIHATLNVKKGAHGALRFDIAVPWNAKPQWRAQKAPEHTESF